MEIGGSLLYWQVPTTYPCPQPDQSSPSPPHPTSWISILILSSKWSLSLRFPYQNPVYTSSHPIHATCPTNLILLHFITWTILGEEYRTLSSSLCCFLYSPVTLSLLGPNILLNTLFSKTLSIRSSLNVSNQVSHPYKTTGKIILKN